MFHNNWIALCFILEITSWLIAGTIATNPSISLEGLVAIVIGFCLRMLQEWLTYRLQKNTNTQF